MDDIDLDLQAQLAALADGSLTPANARKAQDAVDASPQLGDALDEQRRAVSLLNATDVRAPQQVHERVSALIADAGSSRKRRMLVEVATWRLSLATAVTVAVVAVIVAVVVPFSSSGPTLAQAASLGLQPSDLPAPGQNPAKPRELTVTVDGVAYPYWEEHFGYKATGERTDSIDGRNVTTVYYRDADGDTVSYSIVSGRMLPFVSHGHWATRHAVHFEILSSSDRTVVAWEWRGHSCVLSAPHESVSELMRLATWGYGHHKPAPKTNS